MEIQWCRATRPKHWQTRDVDLQLQGVFRQIECNYPNWNSATASCLTFLRTVLGDLGATVHVNMALLDSQVPLEVSFHPKKSV